MSEFILIFYVKHWFESPLPTVAPRSDITFMAKMMRYCLEKPLLAWTVLQSAKRHLWYLTPQLVTLALGDKNLSNEERERMAKILHASPRNHIDMGKPVFPILDWSGGVERPDLSMFIDSKSWLIFDLLELTGPQNWLFLSCNQWEILSKYRQFKEFTSNLAICNNVAEQGVQLFSNYIEKTQDEFQIQALLQVVEYHYSLVSTLNLKKNELKKV